MDREIQQKQEQYMQEVGAMLKQIFPDAEVALIVFLKDDLKNSSYLSSVFADDLIEVLESTIEHVKINNSIPEPIGNA